MCSLACDVQGFCRTEFELAHLDIVASQVIKPHGIASHLHLIHCEEPHAFQVPRHEAIRARVRGGQIVVEGIGRVGVDEIPCRVVTSPLRCFCFFLLFGCELSFQFLHNLLGNSLHHQKKL